MLEPAGRFTDRMAYNRGRALQGVKETILNMENTLHSTNSSQIAKTGYQTVPHNEEVCEQAGVLEGALTGKGAYDSRN